MFMSGLWLVYEQVKSEWVLGQRIAGVTYSTLESHSLGRVPKHLDEKSTAFMSELWEDYERLMSGDTTIPNEIKIPQEMQKSSPEEVFGIPKDTYKSKSVWVTGLYIELITLIKCMWLWLKYYVHERFMNGLRAGYGWVIFGSIESWSHIFDIDLIFSRALVQAPGRETQLGLLVTWFCALGIILNTEIQGTLQESLFDAYSECIRLRIDTIRANGHAKLTVYEWFMRGLWVAHE